MKKSLLALAVMGAFAGAASAQSSVTVYGIVDLGITSQDTGAGANDRLNGITSGNQSASRIGFKGTEDLGNGLKANFVLESGFGADEPGKKAFAFGDRISTIGLSGNFGAVNLGKQVSAIKDAYDQIDPFGDGGTIAPISAIFFNGALKGDAGRVSNSIKYTSNSYSGFKAGVHYAFGEQAGRTGADSNYGLNLGYANGPLNVQFGYLSGDNSTAGAPGFKPVKNSKDKATFLGATYDFGVAKLHAAYGESKLQPVAGNVDSKYRNYMLGVSAKVGAAGSIMASYTVNDTRTNVGVKASDRDSKRAGIMYAHDLSKRTNLYAGYSHTSNDKNAKLNALVADQSGSMFAVGVRHKF